MSNKLHQFAMFIYQRLKDKTQQDTMGFPHQLIPFRLAHVGPVANRQCPGIPLRRHGKMGSSGKKNGAKTGMPKKKWWEIGDFNNFQLSKLEISNL